MLVIGAEPHLPYRRPLLSQGYLTGQTATGDLWLLTDGWCTDNDVEVRPGSPARAVHGTQRAVELADGATLYADALLVATGGRPRQLPNVAGERSGTCARSPAPACCAPTCAPAPGWSWSVLA